MPRILTGWLVFLLSTQLSFGLPTHKIIHFEDPAVPLWKENLTWRASIDIPDCASHLFCLASPLSNPAILLSNPRDSLQIDEQNLASLKPTLHLYNTWFHTVIRSDDLIPVAAERIEQYYKHLQICKPGAYQYPVANPFVVRGEPSTQPLYVLETSIIFGYQHGKCLVENNIQLTWHVLQNKCQYSPSTLQSYSSDDIARRVASLDHQYQEQLNVLARECTISIPPQTIALSIQ